MYVCMCAFAYRVLPFPPSESLGCRVVGDLPLSLTQQGLCAETRGVGACVVGFKSRGIVDLLLYRNPGDATATSAARPLAEVDELDQGFPFEAVEHGLALAWIQAGVDA